MEPKPQQDVPLPQKKRDIQHADMDFIPMARPVLEGNEMRYLAECVESGWVGFSDAEDSFVKRFERGFAKYCGAKHGISVSNGTASLSLILEALGIGPGSEVIIPDITFAAPAFAAMRAGARPVFADVDPETVNISPEAVKKLIGRRTKAIVAVHLYGHPCDMDPLREAAERRGVFLIEDAAQSHGAEYKGRRTGSLGVCSSFSFYGNKLITCGEGGMVLTDDGQLAESMRIIRNQGQHPEKPYWHIALGYNYRMSNVQAALGLAQLERIDSLLARKLALAGKYERALSGIRGIRLPVQKPWAKSSRWMYSIFVEDSYRHSKDELVSMLAANRIDHRPVFYPLHTMKPFNCAGKFPVASELARRGITLPMCLYMGDDDVERVAGVIRGA